MERLTHVTEKTPFLEQKNEAVAIRKRVEDVHQKHAITLVNKNGETRSRTREDTKSQAE